MSSQKFGKDCFVEVQFVDVHPMGCSEALTSSDVVQKHCEGESSVHELTRACCIYIYIYRIYIPINGVTKEHKE